MDQAVLILETSYWKHSGKAYSDYFFFNINFASERTKGLPLPILYQISVAWEEQACYASSLSQDCSAFKDKTIYYYTEHYLETQQLYRVHVLCKLQWWLELESHSVQWNFNITKGQGTGKIIMSPGLGNIIWYMYTKDFVMQRFFSPRLTNHF